MAKKEREIYKDEIIKMHSSNINLTTIASALKVNRLDVKKVLIENGLYINNRKFIKDDTDLQNQIIELHVNEKLSTYQIAERVSRDVRIIKKVIKDHGLEFRNASFYNRKYDINHDCFTIYTPESVYWAGFIAGDGCVYNHGLANKECINYLSVGLERSDLGHLIKLKQFLSYTGKIYMQPRSAALTVNSEKIVSDLKDKYNITNNKTNDYKPPTNIPNKLVKYFILGLFDSDGCITRSIKKRKRIVNGNYIFQISFTGTLEVCEFVKNFFSSSVKIHKRHNNDTNNYTVMFQGNLQIKKYLSVLYDSDSIQFSLDRKRNLFNELVEQYEK